MIEQAVRAVLDTFQTETGIPYARGMYQQKPELPDTYLVWFVVDAPGTAYTNRTRMETYRIQITLYTRKNKTADDIMRDVELRFEEAGFCLVGSVGEDRFETGHFSRHRDFRIRLRRRDFNG